MLILFNTFAELPEAYKAFAPTVDVLPLIPLFFFFGIRIDQSIAFQVTKVPRGEDPSVEVPRRGTGRG